MLLVRVDPAIFSQQVGEASGRVLESPRGASGIKQIDDVRTKVPLQPGNVAVGAWGNNWSVPIAISFRMPWSFLPCMTFDVEAIK